jgi:hypothetical protein
VSFFSKSDFVDVNFTKANLSGIKFTQAFLIFDNFREANLSDTNFEGAYLRHANFSKAKLTGASLKGSDWFNAVGLDKEQILSLLPGGVELCPGENHLSFDEQAFITRYNSLYALVRYNELSEKWGNLLREVWHLYAGPDGLCGTAFKSGPQNG